MVSTGYDTVAIVSGKIRMDPRDITPTEWDAIITAAIKELTIGYISVLVPISQLLMGQRNEMRTEYDLHALLAPEFEADPTLSQVAFIRLGTFRDIPDRRHWPRASAHSDVYAEMRESILALRRGKHGTTKLVQFDIFWQLEEDQDVPGTPDYKLRAKRILIQQDINITELFDSCGIFAHQLGRQALWSLYSAQSSTASSTRECAAAAQKAEQRLESYLTRASVL